MEDLSHYNPEGSVMRKTQLRLLEMLDVFDGICRKHNINYWLVCGTLLGARRHGGFIPWDDDLDVAILQSDCEKVVSILAKELPENLKLQTVETDKKYWYFFPRIRDTKSRHHNKRGRIFENNGIFLDVFLLEQVPSLAFKKIIDKFLVTIARINHVKSLDSLYLKLKYIILNCFLPIVQFIVKLSRFYYKHFNSSSAYAYAYGCLQYVKSKKETFFPVREIMFEGKKYKAPNNIDRCLTDNFDANFMVIPKASDRYSHASNIEFL